MTTRAYRENYRAIEWLPPSPPAPQPRQRVARSHLPAPMLMRDEMEPVQSQVTGKIYDSKSSIRAEYRQHNVIEIGNDPARLRPRKRPRVDRKEIKDTVAKAHARFNRGERAR